MFTLANLKTYRGGEYFSQEDVDYANELILKHDRPFVVDCIRGWAQEYSRVAEADDRSHQEFQRNAYGD